MTRCTTTELLRALRRAQVAFQLRTLQLRTLQLVLDHRIAKERAK